MKAVRPQVYSSNDFGGVLRHGLSSFVYEACQYLIKLHGFSHPHTDAARNLTYLKASVKC